MCAITHSQIVGDVTSHDEDISRSLERGQTSNVSKRHKSIGCRADAGFGKEFLRSAPCKTEQPNKQ